MERTIQLPLGVEVDLRRTLGGGHGPRDPTTSRREGLWRATMTAAGPATLWLHREERAIAARAWGEGAAAVLDGLPALVGLEDRPESLVAQHRVIAELQRAHPGLRLGRGRAVFEAIVPTILGQRVTSEEAQECYRRLVLAVGERAPCSDEDAPPLRLPPQPAAILRLAPAELRELGIDARRARALHEAARHARKIDALAAAAPEEACAFLQRIPGIGPWTATITIATSHGWADAVPIGDYHLPHLVAWALGGEPRGSDERMLALLSPYAGQRGRVVRLLAASGRGAPRFGPRRGSWQFYVERGERRARTPRR